MGAVEVAGHRPRVWGRESPAFPLKPQGVEMDTGTLERKSICLSENPNVYVRLTFPSSPHPGEHRRGHPPQANSSLAEETFDHQFVLLS